MLVRFNHWLSAVSGDVGNNGTPHSSAFSQCHDFFDLPIPRISLIPSIYLNRYLARALLPSIMPKRQSLFNPFPLRTYPKNPSCRFFHHRPQLSPSASPPQHLLFCHSFYPRHPHHSSDKPHLRCLQYLLHFFTNIPGFTTV